jgi:hypothetical protein
MILIAWVCLFKFVAFLSFFTKKLFCHNILFSFEYNKWWKWMNWRIKEKCTKCWKIPITHSFPPLNWIKTKSILLFAFSLATCNNFLSIFSVFFSFYLSFRLFYLTIFHILISLYVCPFIPIFSEKNKSSGVRT